jgi:hypothetical protein
MAESMTAARLSVDRGAVRIDYWRQNRLCCSAGKLAALRQIKLIKLNPKIAEVMFLKFSTQIMVGDYEKTYLDIIKVRP